MGNGLFLAALEPLAEGFNLRLAGRGSVGGTRSSVGVKVRV
jgi:hypothetical protein